MKKYLSENEVNTLALKLTQMELLNHEIQQMAQYILPAVLIQKGLKAAIEELIGRSKQQTGVDLELYIPSSERKLNYAHEKLVYRLIEEILGFVLRFASASAVGIQINQVGNWLRISLEANHGLKRSDSSIETDETLVKIRNRVTYLDGTIDIRSGPGQTISFQIQIPISQ